MMNDSIPPKSKHTASTKQRLPKATRNGPGRIDPFRALVEISADPAVIVDREGLASYINPAFTRLFGYTLDEITNHNLFLLIHPDDLFLAQARFGIIHGQGAETEPVEVRLRNKDGSYRTVEGVGMVLPDGNLAGYLRNLTERKQAEETFRALVDGSVDGTTAGYNHDITERQQAEEALRAIVEGTASATGDDFFRSL